MSFSTRSVGILALAVWIILGSAWMVILTRKGHIIIENDCKWRREDRVIHGIDVQHLTATIAHKNHSTSRAITYSTAASPSQAVIDKNLGNQSFSQRLKHYSSLIFSANPGNCTLVILTYKRVKIIDKVVQHYCSMNQFQRILIIWNDIDTPIPTDLTDSSKSCAVDVKYIVSTKNKLTNRYLPRKEIETNCKCRSIGN